MQQKVALTTAHFPTRGKVADMGSGSGRGTYDLACLHPELELVGVDINPTAVATASETYRRDNLRYLTGDIADPVFPVGSLDGILDSSVLHHVTSFTGYATERLEACLDNQVAALRPGGVLIIRDFVIPDGPADIWCELPVHDGAPESDDIAALSTFARWRRYAATVRNSRHSLGSLPWTAISGANEGWQRIACGLRDAQEFLLRKDYTADWEVELLEEYTYWTQAEFIAALTRRGLRIVTVAPIHNPWIITNRYLGHARLLTTTGKALAFPPTNVVIVGQKVGPTQGTRLVCQASAPVAQPKFLHLSGWQGSDGSSYDLAERPGRTLDLLPWFRRNGQVVVLAKQGFPRPVVIADLLRPNLTGAQWSGYLTEPIAAIVDPAAPINEAVVRILTERAGIRADAVLRLSPPWRYAPSPGGLDEIVTAIMVEIDPRTIPDLSMRQASGFSGVGVISELDAQACLRAAHVGGLFDARLELNCHRLLHELGADLGPWIGAAMPATPDIPAAVTWPLNQLALRPPHAIQFEPAAMPNGFLSIMCGRFAELDAQGQVLATTEREWVTPRHHSNNTVTVLPVIRIAGEWCLGVEHRWLPAIQRATGSAGFAAVPAWRLPQDLIDEAAVDGWIRQHLSADHGCQVRDLVELGGAYLTTPGATPELVHPRVAMIDSAGGSGDLHWLPLTDAMAELDDVVDAHLALAIQRFAHAVGHSKGA